MKKINILGISAFFHDSAVALLQNGEIKYASQEERFSRIKHDSNFPINALIDLLRFNNLTLNQVTIGSDLVYSLGKTLIHKKKKNQNRENHKNG